MENRIKTILNTSIIGIIVNVLLAGFKMVVGGITNSISIVMDGVNNFADAASSFITIIGAALAGKSADKKHPFGYGRMEYISSLVIAMLVLYAGVTSIIESVKKIFSPERSDYSTISLIIIAVAVVVKLLLALYTQAQGKRTNSHALVSSGKEAILDVFVSLATLIAAIVYKKFGLSIEAYLATVISIIIIKAGLELLMETLSNILGQPAEAELVVAIKKVIASFPKVNGAYDLVLNDYGPDVYTASVHIEVDSTLSAEEIDYITRELASKIYEEFNIVLTAVGIYSKEKGNSLVTELENEMRKITLNEDYILGMHGFYVNFEKKEMRFDLVVSLDAKDRRQVFKQVCEKVKAQYPEYSFHISMDMDMNEAIR